MSNSRINHALTADGCSAIEILLADYCAGDLDQVEVALVESHLQQCSTCRAELAREQYLRETLANLPIVPCPARVTEALMAKTDLALPRSRQAGTGQPLSLRWPTFVGWAAVAAALVLLLTSVQDPDQPGSRELIAQPQWTQQEIQSARQDLKLSLLLTAKIINHTERSAVKEVFGHTLPESVTRSIKTLMTTPEGGQG